jgi:hypothetical protein
MVVKFNVTSLFLEESHLWRMHEREATRHTSTTSSTGLNESILKCFEILRNSTIISSDVASFSVAVVAMIREASSNSSVNGLIRRGQTALMVLPQSNSGRQGRETVSTWIVQHCKLTQFLQSMKLSLFSSALAQSDDDNDERIVKSINDHSAISHPDFLRIGWTV